MKKRNKESLSHLRMMITGYTERTNECSRNNTVKSKDAIGFGDLYYGSKIMIFSILKGKKSIFWLAW